MVQNMVLEPGQLRQCHLPNFRKSITLSDPGLIPHIIKMINSSSSIALNVKISEGI